MNCFVRESVIFVGVVGASVRAVFGLCAGLGSISRVLGCGQLGYYMGICTLWLGRSLSGRCLVSV